MEPPVTDTPLLPGFGSVKGRGTAWRIAGRYERRARNAVDDGCIYCYARPTHSYADLSPGLDFETRILAKTNAADRLREELRRPRYTPRPPRDGADFSHFRPPRAPVPATPPSQGELF